MAHPYKQKYNNFNGPGHQSPANNVVVKEIFKKIAKPISRKIDDFWRAAKKSFVSKKFDNSIDWTKTKSKLGKMTIGGVLADKTVGLYHNNERDKAQIVKDNVQTYDPYYPKGITTSVDKIEEQEQKRIIDSIITAQNNKTNAN